MCCKQISCLGIIGALILSVGFITDVQAFSSTKRLGTTPKPKVVEIIENKVYLNTLSWTEVISEAPWEKRAGLQVVHLDEKFYLMGGRSPLERIRFVGESTLHGDVWVSDDGANWTQVLDTNDDTHWPARAYFKAVKKGKYMYVLGGQNFTPLCIPSGPCVPNSTFFNDVWRSEDGINWTFLGNAPWEGRAGLSAVVKGNRIYVFGGSKNDDSALTGGPPVREYFNDVWSSVDGTNWKLETGEAPWSKRAGAATTVKDGYIYLIGGEAGFTCDSSAAPPEDNQGPPSGFQECALPYFNDVWRSKNGKHWHLVTQDAGWLARPGHQCGVLYDRIVCFGGFGIPINPTDVQTSRDGKTWEQLVMPPWNVGFDPSLIKYDFAIAETGNPYFFQNKAIYTFGGDRELFLPLGDIGEDGKYDNSLNFGKVDADVWKFSK
ncbi:hypothetical protein [Vibrio superstes]|uniref:Uncharacterized protein n=1 Tax=Vibrio superstes NBRC 103154 TaxID=1219062 RepID=A0A511QU33_9VIBR|nr:hypothetical protein [Vibrio superstes]GEM80316.1 hypothetical protein VSU01S_25610 [Vibrio superstes NBRC 103154]